MVSRRTLDHVRVPERSRTVSRSGVSSMSLCSWPEDAVDYGPRPVTATCAARARQALDPAPRSTESAATDRTTSVTQAAANDPRPHSSSPWRARTVKRSVRNCRSLTRVAIQPKIVD